MKKHVIQVGACAFLLASPTNIGGKLSSKMKPEDYMTLISFYKKNEPNHSNLSKQELDNLDLSPNLKSLYTYWYRPQALLAEDDNAIEHFFSHIREKNTKLMIRNGNLPVAEKAREHHKTLSVSFKELSYSLRISEGTTRKEFNKIWMDIPASQRSEIWNLWTTRKKKLRRATKAYRKQLKLTLATEIAISRQKMHFPELAERMNSLYNYDSSKLPVYIFSHPPLTRHLVGKWGLSIISIWDSLFTTDSPAVRHLYPELPSIAKALTVHLTNNPSGQVLSHEFGHLYYLYHHWQEYQQYIQVMGSGYQPGGHGASDPSGKAADLAEIGIIAD